MSKRILVLLPSITMGGAERSAIDIVGELVARGHTLTVGVFHTQETRLVCRALEAVGATCVDARIRHSDWPLFSWMECRQAFTDLALLFFRFRPQSVLIFMPEFLRGQYIAGFLRWVPAKTLFSFRCEPPLGSTIRLAWKGYFRLALGGKTKLVAMSESMKSHLCRYFCLPPTKIRVISPGIKGLNFDCDSKARSRVIRREFAIGDCTTLLLYVGRLSPSKGYRDLLHAMPQLMDEVPGIRLVMVGSGEGGADCAAIVDELKLGDSVLFLGHREDAREIIAAADILVLPSVGEGVPRVVLEAFAVGTPVLVSDVPSLNELVGGGKYGTMFRFGSRGALAEGVRQIVADPHAAAVKASEARTMAAGRFSFDRQVDQYEALL